MVTLFSPIRTANPELSRVQDQVVGTLNPIARAVGATPIGGAPLPGWIRGQPVGGVTPIGSGFQPLSYYIDTVSLRVELGGGFTTAGGLVAGDFFMQLPAGARPAFNRAFCGTALVGGVPVPVSFGVRSDGGCAAFVALAAGDSLIIDGASFRVEQ